MERYYQEVLAIMSKVITTQRDVLLAAADCCTQALKAKKMLYFFGTGHSHMLAEEPFYRAGGLIPVIPILEASLMLHEGALKSTQMERVPGIAEILLEQHKIGQGDIIFIISNSGLNSVPIEMAFGAQARGAIVIALTNKEQSKASIARDSNNRKLYEIADLVLDNCGCPGDAAISMNPFPLSVGPTSTIIGAFMINSIVVQIAENFRSTNERPPVFQSANIAGGEAYNAQMIEILRKEGYDIRL